MARSALSYSWQTFGAEKGEIKHIQGLSLSSTKGKCMIYLLGETGCHEQVHSSLTLFALQLTAGDLISAQVCCDVGERLWFLSRGMWRQEHIVRSRRYPCMHTGWTVKQIVKTVNLITIVSPSPSQDCHSHHHKTLLRPRVFQKLL